MAGRIRTLYIVYNIFKSQVMKFITTVFVLNVVKHAELFMYRENRLVSDVRVFLCNYCSCLYLQQFPFTFFLQGFTTTNISISM